MAYILAGIVALFAALWGYTAFTRLRPAARAQALRFGLGGVAVALTALLALARRMDLAAFTGAAAFSILRFGRLGPFTLGGGGAAGANNISKVRSRFLALTLDHDSGAVDGQVISGQFAGADLIDLDEMQSRALIAEVSGDADSVGLLESWLDANRAGWREYFEETAASGGGAPAMDGDAEAYAVLGLKPGASPDEIRAAHRELMKGVHPDHGGSSYLAAKINEARDRLLKATEQRR